MAIDGEYRTRALESDRPPRAIRRAIRRPARLERQYAADIRRYMKAVNSYAREEMNDYADSVALDAMIPDIETIMREAQRKAAREHNALMRKISEYADSLQAWTSGEVAAIMNSAIGVAPKFDPEAVRSLVNAWKRQNEAFITKMPMDTVQAIQDTIQKGLREGEHVRALQRRISRQFGVSERRGLLIARTEMGQFHSQITQERCGESGIGHYFWSASHDERVRDTHESLDGMRFSWDAPPDVGHPGEDFNCRCVAIPDVTDAFAAIGITY